MSREELLKLFGERMTEVKEKHGVKTQAPGKMTYAEFCYFLYRDAYNNLMEEETESFSEKKEKRYEAMLNAVDEYQKTIAEDNKLMEKGKVNSYKYANLFHNIDEAYATSDGYKSMVVPNQNKIATKTSIKVKYDYKNIVKDFRDLCNFSKNNPILKNFLDSSMDPVDSKIVSISNNINGYFAEGKAGFREGALPFVYCAFMSLENEDKSPKYSTKDISEGKVAKEDYDYVYEKIIELGNEKKRKDALEWCDDTFVKGMYRTEKAFDEFVNSGEMKNGKYFDFDMGLVSSVLTIGNTNYFQDKKLNGRIKASEERLIKNGFDLSYKDGTFDVLQAYNANEGEVYSYSSERKMDLYRDLMSFGKENRLNFQFYKFLSAASNVDTLSSNVFLNVMDIMMPDNYENSNMDRQDRCAFSLFILDCMENGKGFQDIYYDAEHNEAKSHTTVDDFMKEFKEFERTHQREIADFSIGSVLEEDKSGFKITEADIERAKTENKKLTQGLYKVNLDGIERLDCILEKVNELENDIDAKKTFPSKENFDKLDRIFKALSNHKKQSYNNKEKFDFLLKLGNEDITFKQVSEEEGKSFFSEPENKKRVESEKKKFDQLLIKIKNLAKEGKNKCEIEVADIKSSVPKEEYDIPDLKVNEAATMIVFAKGNSQLKKVNKVPELKASTERVCTIYESLLGRLRATSKIEGEQLTGNTDLFNKMYDSIKEVAEYKDSKATDKLHGITELMRNANANIREYIKERDSFIKFTQKGRDRLDITKGCIDKLELICERYGDLSEELFKDHQKAVKAIALPVKEFTSEKKENDKVTSRGIAKTVDKKMEDGLGEKG